MSEKKSEMTWEKEEHFLKIYSLYNYHLYEKQEDILSTKYEQNGIKNHGTKRSF